jgi:P27 family predicted phage terminase small subunit
MGTMATVQELRGRRRAAQRGPVAPAHLSDEAREWWRLVNRDYELEPHHLRLLQLAAEAWDTGQAAREALAAEGLTFHDRHGQIKPHPAAAMQREAAASFMRAVRQLGLDEAHALALRATKVMR